MKKPEIKRDAWKSNLTFVMAAIGSAVGLGNLWRFPYVAYKNGGGAFLIPYFIALLTTGIPLMIIEFSLGHIYKGAAPEAFKKIKSKFEWIGWWAVLVALVIVIYYMAVMAWSGAFLFNSYNVNWKNNEKSFFFNKILDIAPTSTEISVKNYDLKFIIPGPEQNLKNGLVKINLSDTVFNKLNNISNLTGVYKKNEFKKNLDNIEFKIFELNKKTENNKNFYQIKLSETDINKLNNRGIFNPFKQVTRLVPTLVISLIIAWFLVYLIICEGVQRVGKIVAWTVPLPLILLAVILIKGITLEGSMVGINHFLKPDFKILSDPQVWLAAYAQIFFSLSIGFGVLIAYASYLPKHDAEITNSAFLTSFGNCATSFFTGFTVFSILGYLAVKSNVDISNVVASGPGLAFVVFPTALAKLPGASFFSILFFITLLLLGIDSAFSIVEAVVSGIDDKLKGKISRKNIVRIVCIFSCIAGLIFVSRAGLYWLDIVDNWINNFGITVVGLADCIIIGYLINIKKFRRKINKHSKIKLNVIWDICVKYISPVVLLYLLGANIIREIESPYEGYPNWMLNIGGWGLMLFIILIALFLMENKKKWKYKLIVIFFSCVITLLAMGFQEIAIFIFGSIFLFGGTGYFLRIALKK